MNDKINVDFEDGKYVCAECGAELTKIIERGMRTLDTAYSVDAYGNFDSDYDIDWDIPLEDGHYECSECEADLGEDMDENLAEDILKHNAGVAECIGLVE